MLIKALCDYYDYLADMDEVLPDGYSNTDISQIVSLSPEGKIIDIQSCELEIEKDAGKSKKKTKIPRKELFPKRTEKSAIDGNIIEQRPLYIFGLNYAKVDGENKLTTEDKTDKAKKSHKAFVDTTLEFLEGLDSPLINAYRLFVSGWNPEEETENSFLLELGKKCCDNTGYMFCLNGDINHPIHKDPLVKKRWEEVYAQRQTNTSLPIAQCAVNGREEPIAMLHNKIRGLAGGQPAGTLLVSFDKEAFCSYNHERSSNSNISVSAMRKYSETLNYLLHGRRHKTLINELTVVYWVLESDDNELYSDIAGAAAFGNTETLGEEGTEKALTSIMNSARQGSTLPSQLAGLDHVDGSVDFYMVGLKPNAARIAVKFVYRKKYGDLLMNIGKHQNNMQLGDKTEPVPIWLLVKQLNPSVKNQEGKRKEISVDVDTSLTVKMMESVVYGTPYPDTFYASIIRRVKTDRHINRIRAGFIKAYLIRNKKEEITLSLDKNNKRPAYVCGRLFAALEKIQKDALGSLNRTIKDAYFSSAASTPAIVFPKLLKLSQSHLKKMEKDTWYQILIQEIIDKLDGQFPETLPLVEQGEFMIGYYQQVQDFFKKKDKDAASDTAPDADTLPDTDNKEVK